ncbi:transposase, partial [Xenorhabdus bovienii]|uniref:transposase n=1 Tax=Xenorhabdus bovienii TaxID=40576 RepID=UPI001E646DE5
MLRTMLTDLVWDKLFALMQHTGLVYHKAGHRLILEGILYRMRTGIPWRDLPLEFGRWNTVFVRFNLIFKGLSGLADREWLFIDGSIVRAHQHSAGAATNEEEAIGFCRINGTSGKLPGFCASSKRC